jgi:hypothetical protein
MAKKETVTETAEVEQAPVAEQTPVQQGESITLQDIRNVVIIIDAATERAPIWKGPELSQIGAVRDKFARILAALSDPAPQTDEEAAA